MKKFLQIGCSFIASGIFIFGQSANAEGTAPEKSCASFVQSFYDWYSKPDLKTRKEHTPERAIVDKGTMFDEQ